MVITEEEEEAEAEEVRTSPCIGYVIVGDAQNVMVHVIIENLRALVVMIRTMPDSRLPCRIFCREIWPFRS